MKGRGKLDPTPQSKVIKPNGQSLLDTQKEIDEAEIQCPPPQEQEQQLSHSSLTCVPQVKNNIIHLTSCDKNRPTTMYHANVAVYARVRTRAESIN